jgi:hypothetical protein
MRARDRDSTAFGGAKYRFVRATGSTFLLFSKQKPETSENERKS